MKNLSVILAATAVLIAFVSCEKIGGNNENNPRKPLELDTKSTEFLQKGNTFAFEFLSRIDAAEKKTDYIVSPLSMQFLLGMVLNGAKGETAEEICRVLGFGAGEMEAVNDYSLALLRQLPKLDKKTKLNIANAIFVNENSPLRDSYKERVGKFYDAEAANLNFLDERNTLKTINGWCNRQTNGMIPEVLDSVDPNVLAYLMNAMYFKSQWREKFDKSKTAAESFTDETGKTLNVKMMKNFEEFDYDETDIYQVVNMAYGNGAYSMVVFLPKEGYKVADVVAALKAADWETVAAEMRNRSVDLWLPRFETKYHVVVKDILIDMGMPRSFGDADFTAMSEYALCLDSVFQDAVIKVDEEGTEAAVVSTAMVLGQTGLPPSSVVFHADHPFLYLIRETSTGAILFAGRYSGK